MCFELSTSYSLISTEEITRLQKEKIEREESRGLGAGSKLLPIGVHGQVTKNKRTIRASGARWQAPCGSLPSSLGTGVCCYPSRQIHRASQIPLLLADFPAVFFQLWHRTQMKIQVQISWVGQSGYPSTHLPLEVTSTSMSVGRAV